MKNLIVVVCLLMAFSSCYNDKADKVYPNTTGPLTCDTTNVTFSGTILPILSQNCSTVGCHDASTQAGGYEMTTYDGFLRAVQSDRLIGDIKHLSGYNPMPQSGGQLSTCDISQIQAWINSGSPNN